MPLYVPGYYNHNKTMGAQHYNLLSSGNSTSRLY